MPRSATLPSALVALLLANAGPSNAVAQEETNISCDGSTTGGGGDDTVCPKPTITDGTTTIRAGQLRYRDLDQGEWHLTGGVSIEMGDAALDADSVVAVREAGEFVYFELAGSPARLTDVVGAEAIPVSGEAGRIVIDRRNDRATLASSSDDIVFNHGDEALRTCELSYDMNDGSFSTGFCESRATSTRRTSESGEDGAAGQRDGP